MVNALCAAPATAHELRAGLRFDARPGSQTQKLQMLPASSNVLPPGGSATQLIRVLGADGVGTPSMDSALFPEHSLTTLR